jgi:hypothetical protein
MERLGRSPIRLPYRGDYLRDITVWSARFSAQVVDAPVDPSTGQSLLRRNTFPGSSLRGALGRTLRGLWCRSGSGCESRCVHPDSCGYALLFGAGDKDDGVRGMTLDPPRAGELYQIAMTGRAASPFEETAPDAWGVPQLLVRHEFGLPLGARFDFVISLFGNAVGLGPELLTALAGSRLPWNPGVIEIEKNVRDGWNPNGGPKARRLVDLLGSPEDENVREIRIVAITPLRIGVPDGENPKGTGFVRKVIERCLVRSREMYDFSRADGIRSPWMAPPEADLEVRKAALAHMDVERFSVARRQRIAMKGLVGHWVVAGDVSEVLALLRAGEVLGVGQHTTVGFGRIVVETNSPKRDRSWA